MGAKSKIQFEWSASMAFKRTAQMFEQSMLALRSAAIQRYIVYETAKRTLEAVTRKIPDSPDYTPYKSALKLVQSGEKRNPIFAIYASPEAAPIAAEAELIYFKPKKKSGRIDPVAAVLIEYQPWTVETLPFDLSDKVATIFTRKVTKREVLQVGTARKADLPDVQRKLTELGISPKAQQTDIPKEVSAVPDLTYTALRLEYGLGKTKAVAHWRPAVRGARGIAESLFDTETVSNALLDWKDHTWRKWRNLRADSVPTKDIASMGKFQSKVGA